jgi:ribosome-associated heat shock protein Hsp15
MTETLRIDKWLWAARFFKTRSLATAAIHAGHVRWNGEIPKPAREVRVGDTLDIALGPMRWTVIVRDLNEQRRPAGEAQ